MPYWDSRKLLNKIGRIKGYSLVFFFLLFVVPNTLHACSKVVPTCVNSSQPWPCSAWDTWEGLSTHLNFWGFSISIAIYAKSLSWRSQGCANNPQKPPEADSQYCTGTVSTNQATVATTPMVIMSYHIYMWAIQPQGGPLSLRSNTV